MKLFALSLLAWAAYADLVSDVRADIARGDFAAGRRKVDTARGSGAWTPETILALSWLGRGAQAARQWDAAERYAAETRQLCLEALKSRKLDDEPKLPTALGASIEVHGHTLAGRGARSEAVAFLQEELQRWRATSIPMRIQKNLNLLTLEGKPAPALEMKEYIGEKPVPVASLKGKPVILFFWAHWCSDCKQQGPILARLQREYGGQGLVVVGPTQRFGYVARGQEAPPDQELRYIGEVRQRFYGDLLMTVPVSQESWMTWGCTSTPTLAVIDRKGVVRSYHPGKMTYEELQPLVAKLVAD